VPHSLLRRYPSLFDLVYVSSYLFESEAFRKIGSTDPNPQSTLSKAYLSMTDGDFIWRQGAGESSSKNADRLLLVTPFMARRNDPMLLLCVKNRRFDARSPWYADRFIPKSVFEKTGQFIGLPEGEWLKNWAVIRHGESNDYFGALDALAKLTHTNEIWHYGQSEDPHHPILGNYLRYTFYKLWIDGKIGYSADNTLAAFNTGLVDNKYEFIYAVFERTAPQNGKCWSLKGFCIPGEQGLGKELLRQFKKIPQPARFFDRTSQLIYEIDYNLPLERQMPYVDYEHIIRDNLSRFPLTFLKSVSFGYNEFFTLLEKVPSVQSRAALDELWEKIVSKIDDDLFLRIKHHIKQALGTAMRRVLWNYKTAIPVYYPAKDTLSWLLPLALTPGRQADVALVVERFGSGNLEGHTVLDLDMAYTNARLISKPESDWLNPTSIEIGMETRLELGVTAAESPRKSSANAVLPVPSSPAQEPEKPKKSGAFSRLASALDILNRQLGRKKKDETTENAPAKPAEALTTAAEKKPEPAPRRKQEKKKPAEKKSTPAKEQKQDSGKQKNSEKNTSKQKETVKNNPGKQQKPAKEKAVSDTAAEKNLKKQPEKPAENKVQNQQKKESVPKKQEQKPAPKTPEKLPEPPKQEKPVESIPEPEVSGKLDAAISSSFLPARSNLDLEAISRHPKRRALAEMNQMEEKPVEEPKEQMEATAPVSTEAPEPSSAEEPAKKKRRHRGGKKHRSKKENVSVTETAAPSEPAAESVSEEAAKTSEKQKSHRRRSEKKNTSAASDTTPAETGAVKDASAEKTVSEEKAATSSEKKNSRSRRSRGGKKKNTSGETSADNTGDSTEKQLSRSVIGKEVALDQVKLRRGGHGIQGYYQGTLVTVAANQMPNAPETYPGTDFKVRILKVNPQGNQYIGRIPK